MAWWGFKEYLRPRLRFALYSIQGLLFRIASMHREVETLAAVKESCVHKAVLVFLDDLFRHSSTGSEQQ